MEAKESIKGLGKLYCTFVMKVTPSQSLTVQEKLFRLGYHWFNNGKSNKKTFNASHYLCFSMHVQNDAPTLRFSFNKDYFKDHNSSKVHFDEFILNFDDVFIHRNDFVKLWNDR